MINLYILELNNNFDNSYFDRYSFLLSDERLQKCHSMKFDICKKITMFSELLIRKVSSTMLGIRPIDITIDIALYGKPTIKNDKSFNFNISHTKNIIIMGVSNSEIGVDIEKNIEYDFGIIEKCFTKNESIFISNHKSKSEAFYEIWTRKESYLKYRGIGLSLPLISFDTTMLPINNMLKTININDYIISICSSNIGDINIIHVHENKVVDVKQF